VGAAAERAAYWSVDARVTCMPVASLQASEQLRKRLAVVLGDVSDAMARFVIHALSAPADLAGVGLQHPEDDAHRGGLAGAVGPGEPEHLPLGDGERQVVEGDQVAAAAD
jgi:hypothetical protein